MNPSAARPAATLVRIPVVLSAKCTMQSALPAESPARFRFNRRKAARFTAATASPGRGKTPRNAKHALRGVFFYDNRNCSSLKTTKKPLTENVSGLFVALFCCMKSALSAENEESFAVCAYLLRICLTGTPGFYQYRCG